MAMMTWTSTVQQGSGLAARSHPTDSLGSGNLLELKRLQATLGLRSSFGGTHSVTGLKTHPSLQRGIGATSLSFELVDGTGSGQRHLHDHESPASPRHLDDLLGALRRQMLFLPST